MRFLIAAVISFRTKIILARTLAIIIVITRPTTRLASISTFESIVAVLIVARYSVQPSGIDGETVTMTIASVQ